MFLRVVCYLKSMFPPRFELGTFCVLDRRDDHYTTETTIATITLASTRTTPQNKYNNVSSTRRTHTHMHIHKVLTLAYTNTHKQNPSTNTAASNTTKQSFDCSVPLTDYNSHYHAFSYQPVNRHVHQHHVKTHSICHHNPVESLTSHEHPTQSTSTSTGSLHTTPASCSHTRHTLRQL